MTNEERLDRLETLVKELIKDYAALRAPLPPTLERQYAPDGSTSITPGTEPGKTYSILGSDGEIIFSVRRLSDQQIFKKGDNTRLYNLDFLIDSFNQTESDIYATLNGITQSVQMTVPLSDLTPLTTGGMSADWAGKVKDWEITAFKANENHLLPGSIHHVEADRVYAPDYLTSECYEIYSVKRLSDGSTWTLGDETTEGVIKGWNIGKDGIGALIGESDCYHINRLQKPAPSVKEWEIVEFKAIHNDFLDMYLNKDGSGYTNDEPGGIGCADLSTMLDHVDNGAHAIHSVRRCSDQTVWSVGQPVGKKDFQNISGTIERFTFTGDTLYAEYADKELGLCKSFISNLTEPPRKPLFTTADGVEVIKGETIYFLSSGRHIMECKAIAGLNWKTHYSTREAAEKARTPLFVTADCVDVFEGDTVLYCFNEAKGVQELAMDQIYKQYHHGWFSTREAALAAYEKWLYEQPVLTINELVLHGFNGGAMEQLVKDKLAKK